MSSVTGTTSATFGNMFRTVEKQLGKDDFLKILAAELQNQSPTNPMDDKDFIAQLAQFSSLEQMQNMAEGFTSLNETLNNYLQKQTSFSTSLNILQSAGLIGKIAVAEVDESRIEGKVEAIRMRDSIPYAVIGGEEIAISSIKEIYEENAGSETNGQQS